MARKSSKKEEGVPAKEIKKMLSTKKKSGEDGEREDYAELKEFFKWLQSLTEQKDTRKQTKADKYF